MLYFFRVCFCHRDGGPLFGEYHHQLPCPMIRPESPCLRAGPKLTGWYGNDVFRVQGATRAVESGGNVGIINSTVTRAMLFVLATKKSCFPAASVPCRETDQCLPVSRAGGRSGMRSKQVSRQKRQSHHPEVSRLGDCSRSSSLRPSHAERPRRWHSRDAFSCSHVQVSHFDALVRHPCFRREFRSPLRRIETVYLATSSRPSSVRPLPATMYTGRLSVYVNLRRSSFNVFASRARGGERLPEVCPP